MNMNMNVGKSNIDRLNSIDRLNMNRDNMDPIDRNMDRELPRESMDDNDAKRAYRREKRLKKRIKKKQQKMGKGNDYSDVGTQMDRSRDISGDASNNLIDRMAPHGVIREPFNVRKDVQDYKPRFNPDKENPLNNMNSNSIANDFENKIQEIQDANRQESIKQESNNADVQQNLVEEIIRDPHEQDNAINKTETDQELNQEDMNPPQRPDSMMIKRDGSTSIFHKVKHDKLPQIPNDKEPISEAQEQLRDNHLKEPSDMVVNKTVLDVTLDKGDRVKQYSRDNDNNDTDNERKDEGDEEQPVPVPKKDDANVNNVNQDENASDGNNRDISQNNESVAPKKNDDKSIPIP
eukprot:CAMPEP_0114672996 /NCGR_PEP_ID=MMETSP0191-20121206/43903_1 /TAXON_ID=126664 /ORGANISM="Sorites sp." /LENGTH=348 /DNA_ID=CAMNT_0001936771 /DNA_START=129 /DNA_END=1172 /DNA_ORIENTATION=-